MVATVTELTSRPHAEDRTFEGNIDKGDGMAVELVVANSPRGNTFSHAWQGRGGDKSRFCGAAVTVTATSIVVVVVVVYADGVTVSLIVFVGTVSV